MAIEVVASLQMDLIFQLYFTFANLCLSYFNLDCQNLDRLVHSILMPEEIWHTDSGTRTRQEDLMPASALKEPFAASFESLKADLQFKV